MVNDLSTTPTPTPTTTTTDEAKAPSLPSETMDGEQQEEGVEAAAVAAAKEGGEDDSVEDRDNGVAVDAGTAGGGPLVRPPPEDEEEGVAVVDDGKPTTGSFSSNVGIRARSSRGKCSVRSSFIPDEERKKGISLRWSNINMKVTLPKSSNKAPKNENEDSTATDGDGKNTNDKSKKDAMKVILEDVWGEALPYQTTAIMGASGAGKTSLFRILSGHMPPPDGKRIVIESDVRVGGVPVTRDNQSSVRKQFAYVGQEDLLFQFYTPREALAFSARLRLPKSTTREEIRDLVQHYLEELRLVKCADSLIGGPLRKGISGGEKRRTSIGAELVTSPSIIFLDEPTSGLDSVAAYTVMDLLDRVAKAGNTVLFTIHQPSSKVFFSFDSLILMRTGRIMYTGPTRRILQDFADRHYPTPGNINPADWILEVSEEHPIEELQSNGFFPSNPRSVPDPNENSEEMAIRTQQLASPETTAAGDRNDHVSVVTQSIILLQREWIGLVRFPTIFLSISCAALVLGVISSILFFRIGAQDRADPGVLPAILGALVVTIMTGMMMAGGISQSAFGMKPLFLKEYATEHYRVIPYLLAKFTSESLQAAVVSLIMSVVTYFMAQFTMPFWSFYVIMLLLGLGMNAMTEIFGAMMFDQDVAKGLISLAIMPQFYFSGVVVSVTLMPVWIRWIQYLCLLRYGVGLSLIYEFGDCGSPEAQESCDEFLAVNGIETSYLWWYWVALVSLFAVMRILVVYFTALAGKNYH